MESLENFFKSLLAAPMKWLVKSILATCNDMTTGLAEKIGSSPQNYNSHLFTLAQNMNTSVIIPIAGVILTFVMCYDLIQILIDRNNLSDTDYRVIVKWIVKSFVGIILVSKAWTIVMAFFDLGTWIVQKATESIDTTSKADLSQYSNDEYISALIEQFKFDMGQLIINFILLLIFYILLMIIYICTCVIVYFRFMEMIIYASVAALPLSTFGNNEWRHTGNNYLANIMALALQGFIMIFALGGLSVMSANLVANGEFMTNLVTLIIYELTCFVVIKKSSQISKSLFGAH